MNLSEFQAIISVLELPAVFVHVAAGFVALVMAPIAMRTRKGGPQHRRWGKVYFWAMFVIFLTALALVYFRPNFFLFMVAFLSFYGAFSGYRALFRKRAGQVRWLDWLGAAIALVAGVLFAGWGLLGAVGLIDPLFPRVFSFIAIGFGFFLGSDAWRDIRSFRQHPANGSWWWTYHIERMSGSYVAAVTAFAVQNLSRLLPPELVWIPWVLPALIGLPLIARTVRAYHKKLNSPARPTAQQAVPAEAA